MSPTLEQNHPILEVLKPDCTANRFSFRGSQIMVPAFDPDHLLFHVIIAPDGSRQIKALTPQESGGRIPGQPYDLLARVRRQCSDFPLSFPSQQTDPQGHAWDFLCGGILSVADGQRFVEKCFGLASVGAPLRRDRLAAWLAQELSVPVADILRIELGKETFEALRGDHVLPAEWWAKRFAPALERFGLHLTGLRTHWESAAAQRAEQAERERLEQAGLREQVEAENRLRQEQSRRDQEHANLEARLQAEQADRKRDLELKGLANQAQLDSLAAEFKLRRVREEQKLQEDQLAGQIRLQEMQRAMEKRAQEHECDMTALRGKAQQQRRQEAETEKRSAEEAARKADFDAQRLVAELARDEEALKQAVTLTAEQRASAEFRIQKLRFERDKAGHEVKTAAERTKIAELERQKAELAVRQAQEDLENAQARRQQSEQSHQAQNQVLVDLQEEIHKVFVEFKTELLTGLFNHNSTKVYNAASWVTTQGVSAQHLQDMGINTRLNFIERLQASTVEIRKNNLKRQRHSTRDIVTGPVQDVVLDTLLIGELVNFEFTSPRAGFVTLINPGTSGKFWLHAPNAYRPMPRVEARRAYQVPGPELLPEDRLRAARLDYFENGPEGWEYLVVIVSAEPLMDTAVVDRSRETMPVIELSDTELLAVSDRLDRMGQDHWAAGVAKFRVARG